MQYVSLASLSTGTSFRYCSMIIIPAATALHGLPAYSCRPDSRLTARIYLMEFPFPRRRLD